MVGHTEKNKLRVSIGSDISDNFCSPLKIQTVYRTAQSCPGSRTFPNTPSNPEQIPTRPLFFEYPQTTALSLAHKSITDPAQLPGHAISRCSIKKGSRARAHSRNSIAGRAREIPPRRLSSLEAQVREGLSGRGRGREKNSLSLVFQYL